MNETPSGEVSNKYIQQVNTEMLVNELREAVMRALTDHMQFATAIGTLLMMAREIEDMAIAQLQSTTDDIDPVTCAPRVNTGGKTKAIDHTSAHG